MVPASCCSTSFWKWFCQKWCWAVSKSEFDKNHVLSGRYMSTPTAQTAARVQQLWTAMRLRAINSSQVSQPRKKLSWEQRSKQESLNTPFFSPAFRLLNQGKNFLYCGKIFYLHYCFQVLEPVVCFLRELAFIFSLLVARVFSLFGLHLFVGLNR